MIAKHCSFAAICHAFTLCLGSKLGYATDVKLSVKSDYAARAVLSLARHYGESRTMKIEELASENRIPPNYLVQIMIDLKSRHIVRSVRGKEGGYRLSKPPSEISLGEVLRAIHGAVFDTTVLEDSACPEELRTAWKSLQKALDNAADGITFQQLAEDPTSKQRMYYI
jgi:Rrf2 family transcriptional regulator, cysteine metabolism repressor